jgi:8-oxo-dGTP pyrophosphatase MutT (NUDIX family)
MPPAITLAAIRQALATHVPERMPEMGRPAAVLVPLFERDGRVFVLLTKRTEDLSSHAGQISFPGGKQDEGESEPRLTALREAQEEVGLDPSAVEIIGALDDCPTFVTNFVISPVVGVIPDHYPFTPNASEIQFLIEAPLDDFLLPGTLRTETRQRGEYTVQLFYYSVVGQVVWGATARILTELFSRLGIPVEMNP